MSDPASILIVDNDPSVRILLEDTLNGEGYRCITASSGYVGLDMAAHHLPNLILLDVMMPELDGFTVCEQLRATPTLAEIPVILITVLDDQEARMRGFEVGADNILSKPIYLPELCAQVRTITRLSRHRRLVAEERAARFRLLVEMGRDFVSITSLQALLALALQRIIAFSGYEGGSILLIRPSGTGMDVCASAGVDAVTPGTAVDDLEHSVSGRALALQQPLILEGTGEAIGTDWRTYTRMIPSSICLPLISAHGRSIGVLSLKKMSSLHPLSPDDLDALQLLASQLAVIIERSRLAEDNMHLLQELAERESRLQFLVEKLLVSQEEERRRIAYELHDGLAQVAASAYQHWQTFASSYHPRSLRRIEQLNRAMDLTRQVVSEARQMMAGLRPTVLDDFGLVSAVRLELERLQAEGWEVSYTLPPHMERLPATVETAFFRVAQEALTNIRKHAGYTQVHLGLKHDDTWLRLEIRDWGRGFDSRGSTQDREPGKHMGLIGMQERLMMLGGHCHISSQPGAGTHIVAEAPIAGEEDRTYADTR